MSKRRAIKTCITIVLLIISTAIYASNNYKNSGGQPAPQPGYYKVTHATDGDTFSIDMNSKEERIRMIGVDTPETKKPNSPVQCYGPEASGFTKKLLEESGTVRLEADPIGNNRDKYDRLLRYVYLQNGALINERLITEGYGFAYLTFQFSKQTDFAAAQASAQGAKRGLWATCQPKLNGGRWQSNDL